MDFNYITNKTKGGEFEEKLYNYAPNLITASHRMQKTFFRRCTEQINLYESCLGSSW